MHLIGETYKIGEIDLPQHYRGLYSNEEDQKGCTEKLQTWNQPRNKKVDTRPTNLVMLTNKVYGIEKRPKVCSVNQCTSRRATHPERKAYLRNRLSQIKQVKIEVATMIVRKRKQLRHSQCQCCFDTGYLAFCNY